MKTMIEFNNGLHHNEHFVCFIHFRVDSSGYVCVASCSNDFSRIIIPIALCLVSSPSFGTQTERTELTKTIIMTT